LLDIGLGFPTSMTRQDLKQIDQLNHSTMITVRRKAVQSAGRLGSKRPYSSHHHESSSHGHDAGQENESFGVSSNDHLKPPNLLIDTSVDFISL